MIRNSLVGLLFALALVLAGCPNSSPSAIWLDGSFGDVSTVDSVPPVDVVVGPSGCETNEDCETGVCNPFTHTCVMCMTDGDCPAKHECDKWTCLELPECQEDGDCDGLVCWEEEEVCVECLEDTDCPAGECLDQDCVLPCGAGCPAGTFCDELTNYCIECLTDENCLEEEWCYPLESECVEDQCLPGALGCVGNKTAVCAENGSGWTGLEECPFDYVCVGGACQDLQVCEPGLVSCKDATTVHICNDDGTKLAEEPCAPGLFCNDGKCLEECVAECGDQECGPSNCPGYDCGICNEGTHCDGGVCVEGICPEGATACMGNAVVFCLGPEEGWSDGKPCPPGSQCEDGECQNVEPSECAEVLDCMMDFAVEEPDPFFLEKCMGPDGDGNMAIEIFFCVFEMCGNWSPESACFEKALKGECGWLYDECMGGCTPFCGNKECGSDGCGGVCGWCPDDMQCNGGQCQPWGQASCNDVIGCMMDFPCPDPDGWGCLQECSQGEEIPELAQELYWCVIDFCGIWMPFDECFEFALKEGCGDLYQMCMECEPSCWGQECGGDGCGGSCGWCEGGLTCQNGQCVPGGDKECAEVLDCLMAEDCVAPEPWWCLEQCVGPNQEPPDLLYELVDCVMMFCGGWFPGDECFYFATQEACYDLYHQCTGGGCEKQCAGKQCGPDGCGGSCGYCPDKLLCTGAGKCEKPCEAQCWSADGTFKECGSDGCGGSCGVCPPGSSCNSGGNCIQVCEADCSDVECGSDGCGGSCGLCDVEEACMSGECIPSLSCEELTDCMWSCPPDDEQCGNECYFYASPAAKQQWADVFLCVQEVCGPNSQGSCVAQAFQGECAEQWNACQDCTPECVGKQCGADGCGGACGECPGGYSCDNFGTCLCQPQCQAKECGNDGCAGSCGTCGNGETCNAWGFCVCQPKCTLSDGTAKECGGDGCGSKCGVCQAGYQCTDAGKCISIGPNSCGNGVCNPGKGENCNNCPQDCECKDSCCEEHESVGCNEPKVKECVCNMDPFCCEAMWDGICVDEAINQCNATCNGGCEENCFNKECGPDGCEGSCGSCPTGSTCNAGGICEQVCKPNCAGKECGSDGCGGSCGLCGVGEACKSGSCIAALSCAEMLACLWSCPPDDEGCGNECWQDASPDAKQQWWALGGCTSAICGDEPDDGCWQMAVSGPCQDEWNECQNCTADCVGKQCGDDGCGGECGECPGGYVCDNFGSCLCEPQCDNKSCGNDGCGGSCGTCPGGSVCNYLGQCVCMPQCGDKECGSDGCGGSCGGCPAGQVCNGQGLCQDAPEQCGNDKCQQAIGENCQTCPEDCGECDSCGNGWCQQWLGETCQSCPEDCGECETCGNGWCQPGQGESCSNCPEDCGQCQGGGDCCETHETPGCDDPDISGCVCGMDPFCCNNYWDDACVQQAQDCGANCGGGVQTCEEYLDCMMQLECPPDMPFEACLFECSPNGELPGASKELVYCVYETCNGWNPKSFCFEFALTGQCGEFYKECVGGGCEPQCTIFGFPKECGDDGCGGSCGACPWGQKCDANTFQCVESCTPQCNGKECGGDGCGGSCGTCGPGEQCSNNGQCTGSYTCGDMIECAIDCQFGMNCVYACMSNGSGQSQQLFQQLTACVVQSCGFNVDIQCIIQSFQGDCGESYKNCMND
jgi:hypothetical protein